MVTFVNVFFLPGLYVPRCLCLCSSLALFLSLFLGCRHLNRNGRNFSILKTHSPPVLVEQGTGHGMQGRARSARLAHIFEHTYEVFI